jgi:hypothetical protein
VRLDQLVEPTDVDTMVHGITAEAAGSGMVVGRALHDAVTQRFGRAVFCENLRQVLCFLGK